MKTSEQLTSSRKLSDEGMLASLIYSRISLYRDSPLTRKPHNNRNFSSLRKSSYVFSKFTLPNGGHFFLVNFTESNPQKHQQGTTLQQKDRILIKDLINNNLFLSPSWPLSQQPAIDSEAMRVRGIIVLVKSNQLVKNIEAKQLQLAKRDSWRFSRHCFGFQSRRFSLLVGYNIQPSSSSTSQNAALIIDHQFDFTNRL